MRIKIIIIIIFLWYFSPLRLLQPKAASCKLSTRRGATRSAGRWYCQRGWPNRRITRDTGQGIQWRRQAGIIDDWRWKMAYTGRIWFLGWNWLETVGICKGFRQGQGKGWGVSGRAVRWFVISATQRQRQRRQKSHGLWISYTFCTAKRVGDIVAARWTVHTECIFRSATCGRRRQAAGSRRQEAAKVCHDSFAIVPRD